MAAIVSRTLVFEVLFQGPRCSLRDGHFNAMHGRYLQPARPRCRPRCTGPRRWLRTRWLKISRSEEHTSELQSQSNLVCRLLLEKKKKHKNRINTQLNSIHSQIANSDICFTKKQITFLPSHLTEINRHESRRSSVKAALYILNR